MVKKLKRNNHPFVEPKKSWVQKMEFVLQKIDIFEKPVTFTINRENGFRSNVGGVSTIIVGVIMFIYFITEMIALFSYDNVIVNSVDKSNNIVENPKTFDIGVDDTFAFGLNLKIDGVDYIADPTYVTLEISMVKQVWDGSGSYTRVYTDLGYEKWGTSFNKINANQAATLGLSEYYCPTDKTYTVKGSFYSNEYRYIEINLYKCTGADWATDIDTVLTNSKVNMAVLNTNIDLYDYGDPLDTYIDDGFYWDLTPDFRK